MNLPASLTRKVLSGYVATIQQIRGTLHVRNNMYRTGMNFFTNLQSVDGIAYFNNPLLTDTRLSNLKNINGNVTVAGCPRLCTQRYTMVGAGPDDSNCTNTDLNHFFQVLGDISMFNATRFADIMARAARNITANQVNYMHSLFFIRSFDALLKWNGRVQTRVVEQGSRWINLQAILLAVNTKIASATVDASVIPNFAVGAAEMNLVHSFSFTNIVSAFFTPTQVGYNEGSWLIGLVIKRVARVVLTLFRSCHTTVERCSFAVDSFAFPICSKLRSISPCCKSDPNCNQK